MNSGLKQFHLHLVSDATGDLSDSCAACHNAYREVRVRGRAPDPTDPSNKSNRCLSRSTK